MASFELSQFSDEALNLKGITGLHPWHKKRFIVPNSHISSYWPTQPHTCRSVDEMNFSHSLDFKSFPLLPFPSLTGKPFDELHKWCAKEKSALAAELRAPTLELCRRWRRQPKPAAQEQSPEDKAMRRRVVELISQGLSGGEVEEFQKAKNNQILVS